MKTPLRILAVSFDLPLQPWELPQFRGAIARKVGWQHEWFHNHDNTHGGYHQRYPLLQYKIERSADGLRPQLLCLQTGIEEAHHLFSQPDWDMQLGQRAVKPLRVARLHVDQYWLHTTDQPRRYRIHQWKPFNSDNYHTYRQIKGLAAQYTFLEQLLVAHLLAFASGVGWQLTERFNCCITDVLRRDWIDYKGIKVLGFTLAFEANVALPMGIGLGKGVSMGYGVVKSGF